METRAFADGRDRRASSPSRGVEADLEPVRRALSGLRFGEVRVIVQDGVVVQIERIEKERLR
ncbi:hypothetical protein OJF2_32720 [Aquisphaera giovannonii]|uniref:DUF2292 domain-containing protein n=1 Tax=Aquisphaera giovannonii TaxID=406548 RepID=A0A5B9W439_9BACT|nr:YezD family protein [Aquisphaera giovannonii]QEH34730.1 hypothetical protein OJF2_32720 [Aquisphaera giovannonii]